MDVGAPYTEAGVEAEAEAGGGSLATLVSFGAMTGERDGVCAGCGAGAVAERVGACTAAAIGEGADTGAAVETAPVSSETYLSATGLPEKNSPAERQGSMEGADGKMSDWNESDCTVVVEGTACVSQSVARQRIGNEGGR